GRLLTRPSRDGYGYAARGAGCLGRRLQGSHWPPQVAVDRPVPTSPGFCLAAVTTAISPNQNREKWLRTETSARCLPCLRQWAGAHVSSLRTDSKKWSRSTLWGRGQ